MQIGILGPLELRVDGALVSVDGARLRAVLVRLALDAGQAVDTDQLVVAVWGDAVPADPGHALQSLISRLRRVLPAATIDQTPGGYRLDCPPEAVDVARFERLARDGRRALLNGDPTSAEAPLVEALALWRGEALTDARPTPHTLGVAARLAELRLTAIEDLADARLCTHADRPALVAELERLRTAHPLRERLCELTMRAYRADGRVSEALAAYERYRVALADELGTDPGARLRELHLSLLRGDASPRRTGNLRAPLTGFIGRDREYARVGEQFGLSRLVTLVGAGGAGKSRLATEFGAGMRDRMPGGVWLVELAAVSDPADVAWAVASALDLRDAMAPDPAIRPRDPVSRLAEALPATDTLLVLDNCEHVIDAAARLADELLGRCPLLRVLATSREPLNIGGEALCPVPPMAVPAHGASTAEALAQPAVQLFVARARAVRAGFTITDDNVTAVVEICRRLDGLPLAIELAAARLRTLGVEQVADRLADRFQVLTGGSRTALPRHRTLRAVVAWSWDLLDDRQRRLIEWLSVFPSVFAAEAVGRVCPGVDNSADPVEELVDRSLLYVVDGRGTEPRYRMLDTVREYGQERLAAAGNLATARRAYLGYVLDVAERAAPHLTGVDQVHWVGELADVRADLIAAQRLACDSGDAQVAIRVGAALAYYWTISGDHTEAAERLRAILAVPGPAPRRARLDVGAMYLLNAVLSGDAERTTALADELRVDAAAEPGYLGATLVTAMAALIDGSTAAGLAALDARPADDEPWAAGMRCLVRSFLDGSGSDMPAMMRDLVAAADEFRAAGDRWGLVTVLANLGFAHAAEADFDHATAVLRESLELARELGTDGHQRVWLAMVHIQAGDLAAARRVLHEVVDAAVPAALLSVARILLATVARIDGDLDEADRLLRLASPIARPGVEQEPDSEADGGAAGWLRVLYVAGAGHLAVDHGEMDAASTRLTEAVELAAGMRDMPMVAMVGVAVAALRLRQGHPIDAAEALGAAHALRGAPDAHHPDVIALHRQLSDPAHRAAYRAGSTLPPSAALARIRAQVRAARCPGPPGS